MKLSIRHRTHYSYRRPVALLPHRLLAVPRASAELRLIDFVLDAGSNASVRWSDDVFGNRIATIGFTGEAEALVIDARMLVELDAPAWPLFAIAVEAHRYPFAYGEGDRRDLGRLAQPRRDGQDAIAALARSFIASTPTDTLSLLKDLNAGMRARIAYETRDEEGTRSPVDTLAAGAGSCRDIAALFIECARTLGFAARAVSGYLHDPDRLGSGQGATHAWAEIFLPGAGWIAFDPTHGRIGDAFLVPVAVAYANQQIMPLTGSFVGTSDDLAGMEVDIQVNAIEPD